MCWVAHFTSLLIFGLYRTRLVLESDIHHLLLLVYLLLTYYLSFIRAIVVCLLGTESHANLFCAPIASPEDLWLREQVQ